MALCSFSIRRCCCVAGLAGLNCIHLNALPYSNQRPGLQTPQMLEKSACVGSQRQSRVQDNFGLCQPLVLFLSLGFPSAFPAGKAGRQLAAAQLAHKTQATYLPQFGLAETGIDSTTFSNQIVFPQRGLRQNAVVKHLKVKHKCALRYQNELGIFAEK